MSDRIVESTERSLMRRHGKPVILHRKGSSGQSPATIRARFEPRKARIIDGTRAVRDELWSVVLADEAALRPPDDPENPSPPVPGDWFDRPHGPKLRIVAGGFPVAAGDGRAISYHNPVMEVA